MKNYKITLFMLLVAFLFQSASAQSLDANFSYKAEKLNFTATSYTVQVIPNNSTSGLSHRWKFSMSSSINGSYYQFLSLSSTTMSLGFSQGNYLRVEHEISDGLGNSGCSQVILYVSDDGDNWRESNDQEPDVPESDVWCDFGLLRGTTALCQYKLYGNTANSSYTINCTPETVSNLIYHSWAFQMSPTVNTPRFNWPYFLNYRSNFATIGMQNSQYTRVHHYVGWIEDKRCGLLPYRYTFRATPSSCGWVPSPSEGFVVQNNQSNPSTKSLQIYPNPANDNITVSSLDFNSLHNDVILYNQLGQIVLQNRIQGEQGVINTSDIQSGLYILKIKNENGFVKSSKVEIKH
jgi:hypothetical protein